MQTRKQETHFVVFPSDKKYLFLFLTVIAVFYFNSFYGAFVFDDGHAIVDNPHIRSLWPLSKTLWTPSAENAPIRPLINLTFAINYALGGLNPLGYHAVNLAIHIFAAFFLFGILKRTLSCVRIQQSTRESADTLSFVVTLLWAIHPLQTQSVTYIVQRAESLMGLFYLMTLYYSIRSYDSPMRKIWVWLAIGSSFLGMATKEVMITAPFLVLCHDRVFLSGSFLEALRRRRAFYVGLASSWSVLLGLYWLGRQSATQSTVGFSMEGNTPWTYAMTEPGVILHYLRLVVWPWPLILDYGYFAVDSLKQALLPIVIIVTLLAMTLWSFWKKSIYGFFGLWFFLILAPTSSFIPLADPCFEHRMYLPLAAVILACVVAAHKFFNQTRLLGDWKRPLQVGVITALVLVWGSITLLRNNDYRSAETMWKSTLKYRPQNARVYDNLAFVAVKEGDYEKALFYFKKSFEVNPTYGGYANSIGVALAKLGRHAEAIDYYARSVQLSGQEPDAGVAHNNWGLALTELGQMDEAIKQYQKAVELKPNHAEAHFNLGSLLAQKGDWEKALWHSQEAIRLKPGFAEAWNNAGFILANLGKDEQALRSFRRAVELKPDYPSAKNNLAALLSEKKATSSS